MDYVFYRIISISASSTSESFENKRVINSEEITIEDFTKNIDNWKIPKVSKTQIHQNSKFDLFKIDFTTKLKNEIFSSQNPLKQSNSFLLNPWKNIKIKTTNIFMSA